MKNTGKMALAFFLSLCMLACSTVAFAQTYTAGTYTGTAAGFSGNIKATVTTDDNQITAITIDESENSNRILNDDQLTALAEKILSA